MAGLDVIILTACLGLLALTAPAGARTTAAGEASAAPVPGALPSALGARRPAIPLLFLVAAYLIVVGEALQLGLDKDSRTEAAEANATRTVALRYGDPAPPFALRAGSGQVVSAASLRGRWSLLTFVQPGCSACELEVRDIARQWSAWGRRMNGLVVLPGRPLMGSPGWAAREFRSRLGLPMEVACDPDQLVTRSYCDRPLHTPFSVLLDRSGAVRLIQDGRGGGEFGLVNQVNSLLSDEPYGPRVALLRVAALGRRAPDGEILMAGKWVKLSALWRRRPVVLAFVLRNCGGCTRHVDALERALGNSRFVSVVYVYPTAADAAASSRSRPVRGLVAADARGAVHTAYQVWRAPATFLLRAGRILYASGPRSNPLQFERLIRDGGAALVRNRT